MQALLRPRRQTPHTKRVLVSNISSELPTSRSDLDGGRLAAFETFGFGSTKANTWTIDRRAVEAPDQGKNYKRSIFFFFFGRQVGNFFFELSIRTISDLHRRKVVRSISAIIRHPTTPKQSPNTLQTLSSLCRAPPSGRNISLSSSLALHWQPSPLSIYPD